ncbi:nematocyst expressed protein 3-like [Leucoraja erinacea]|uniref:nematocyst expressed protein 3-like n=1 Tax=Leucoraja erinaceus TaxID=7782 RepID=UPI002457385E|nr:nematocyst expressed protein 3-like [Leucoraja erinacea]
MSTHSRASLLETVASGADRAVPNGAQLAISSGDPRLPMESSAPPPAAAPQTRSSATDPAPVTRVSAKSPPAPQWRSSAAPPSSDPQLRRRRCRAGTAAAGDAAAAETVLPPPPMPKLQAVPSGDAAPGPLAFYRGPINLQTSTPLGCEKKPEHPE